MIAVYNTLVPHELKNWGRGSSRSKPFKLPLIGTSLSSGTVRAIPKVQPSNLELLYTASHPHVFYDVVCVMAVPSLCSGDTDDMIDLLTGSGHSVESNWQPQQERTPFCT